MRHPFEPFVRRFLAVGAIGTTLGLSAVSITPPNQNAQHTPEVCSQQPFSARLNTVRTAVSASASLGSATKSPMIAQFRNID